MEARDDLSTELFFTAEKVSASGYIEKQAFWRIEHDNRRESFAPCSDIIERARVFFGIDLYRL